MAESTALEALTAELLGDVGKLHDEVKALKDALPGAADLVRQAGQEAAATLQEAVHKAVAELGKSAAEVEAEKLRASFLGVAESVLQEIREQASASAPSRWKVKVALSLCLMALVSAAAGAVVGVWYTGRQHSDAEARQIAAGKDFLKVLPQLDPGTRDKIVRLIEKNR